jgi:hypothetical protein
MQEIIVIKKARIKTAEVDVRQQNLEKRSKKV